MNSTTIREIVREGYANVARAERSCCPDASCCGGGETAASISKQIGYTEEELRAVPEGANLGLGCGNPVALASLKAGETVLDLGSGAGFDCFLAANRVGKEGRVIGVDMTPEMIEKARANAQKGDYENVEFRLGEIEHLPVADGSADMVISNCVINLSPEKEQVFREAFRVLKPGGRLMVSDIVLSKELPEAVKDSVEAYVGCLSGAILRSEYKDAIRAAGFQEVSILEESSFSIDYVANDPTAQAIMEDLGISLEEAEALMQSVISAKVYAVKPEGMG